MSILINVEMPASCTKCIVGQIWMGTFLCPLTGKGMPLEYALGMDHRMGNCPLIELPDGREAES